MEFSQKLCLAQLQLQINTFAKYKANRTKIVGGVVRTTIFNVNQGQLLINSSKNFHEVASCTSTTPNEHFC